MDLLEKKLYEAKGRNIQRHPWELAREKIINRIIQKAQRTEGFQHLDIGCGDGFIVSSMARHQPGGTFYGVDIELDDEQIDRMNRAAPANLRFFRDLADVELPEGGAVSFTLMDVIEHIADEVATLEQLRQKKGVAPGATFFITVPAWQFLFSPHDVFLKHYRRYTIASLKHAVSRAGLKGVEFHYFFFSLFLARALKTGLYKLFGKKEAVPESDLVWNFGDTAARAVSQILYAEYKIMRGLAKIGINLPGLSVFGMARK